MLGSRDPRFRFENSTSFNAESPNELRYSLGPCISCVRAYLFQQDGCVPTMLDTAPLGHLFRRVSPSPIIPSSTNIMDNGSGITPKLMALTEKTE